MERKIFTNEDSEADGDTEPKALVMAVPQAYRETASVEAGAQVHHSEHAISGCRYGVFLLHDANLAKAEGLPVRNSRANTCAFSVISHPHFGTQCRPVKPN